MKRLLKIVTLIGLAFLFGRNAYAAPLKSLKIVQDVDLKRYAGTWYEIARLPQYFERNCASDVKAQYTLKSDGTVDVLNSCKRKDGKTDTAHGIAKQRYPKTKIAHLKVTFVPEVLRFIPAAWADYCVIELDDNYQYALIGEPKRRYLWVLSRQPKMDDELYEKLLAIAREQGFDTSKIIRVHSPG